MRKYFLLALPLASLVFAAGCSCASTPDECAPCIASAAVVEAPAVVYADAGVVRNVEQALHIAEAPQGGDVLSEERYNQLLAEGKVTAIPGYTPSAPKVASRTPSRVVEAVETSTAKPVTITVKEKAPAPVVAPVVAMGVKKDESKDEMISASELVSPSKVITPAQILNYSPTATVVTAQVTEPAAEVRTIPGMALPKGWDYIHEKDLSGGHINEVPDQFFSAARKTGSDI